ncbi:glycoside hydrolase family 3 N-terminal domain-containing protein [Bdellovibrionota bacterium FG-1]
MTDLRVGKLFILGFRGTQIPSWLLEFEKKFGLGGVILFDYNCQTRTYQNNIESPAQVRKLCAEISQLPSRPLLFIDQEGGNVRRLKEKLGFAPFPSAKVFNGLSADERKKLAENSFAELRALGFDYNLAPVIDIDYNPESPDIGKVERSFSDSASEVQFCAETFDLAARKAGLKLCLKHFPGIGGARTNSHEELTDLSGTIMNEQLELFYRLGTAVVGRAILVSHGIVRDWDAKFPVSMSPSGIGRLRERLPDALLLSDDLQMQGLQKILPSPQACIQGIRAGLDRLILGNNLMSEDALCLDFGDQVRQLATQDQEFAQRCEESIKRHPVTS